MMIPIAVNSFHIKNGTNGLVPAGTTGEFTLSHSEHEREENYVSKKVMKNYLYLLGLVPTQPRRLYL